MTNINANLLLTHSIHRSTFINILETALQIGEHRFARRAALNWLTDFPGDLYVNFLNVKAFAIGKGNPDTAFSLLRQLVHKDPMFLLAYELALDVADEYNLAAGESFRNCYYAAGGNTDSNQVAEWSISLRRAREYLLANDLDKAENELLTVIAANPPTPLAAITHIDILERKNPSGLISSQLVCQKIIEHYYNRWETCLQIRLFYAQSLLESNKPERGVELLHAIVVEDPAGQVVNQQWGSDHPYRNLWPDNLSGVMNDPLPASISAWFGLNLISVDHRTAPNGTQASDINNAVDPIVKPALSAKREQRSMKQGTEFRPKLDVHEAVKQDLDPNLTTHYPEELISTSETLNHIASRIQRPDITHSDGRFPIYVILTSIENLTKQYGHQGTTRIIAAVEDLKNAISGKKNWSALAVPVDDPKTAANLNIRPVRASDPWAIKRTLIDLDTNLARQGEMIGALLIIGGPQIIPFHLLPNPVDDQDQEIPSDNPYGTRDENYFTPEWPVGRIPGDTTTDIRPLIKVIEAAAGYHRTEKKKPGWLENFWTKFCELFVTKASARYSSSGYTAAIWRRASEVVYQQIGDRKKILLSPPATSIEFRKNQSPGRFAYFNLHGIQESPDWYGHKDPSDSESGPDYPVAIKPDDVPQNNSAPLVVFSEACYGAYIEGKLSSQSIPLKFLENGTFAFIGSTATSYGSVSTPLIAADLLGHQFWKFIDQGIPAGEALRRAKIELIRTMSDRQGYLDGEDQKTIISFVLYGDPLLFPFGIRRLPKDIYRPLQQTEVQTVCDKNCSTHNNNISDETTTYIKKIVRQYLPGMEGATIRLNKIEVSCKGGDHNCPTTQLHNNSKSVNTGNRQVIVISKRFQSSSREFVQYARMTIDDQGQVIKLAVSR